MNKNWRRINLMLIEEGDKFHYTYIKDFNKLLYNQSKHEHRKFFCENCLTGYSTKEFLENHKKDCNAVCKNSIRIEMPEEGKNVLKFKHFYKQQKFPFVIYTDFEAIINKIEKDPNAKANKENTQLHEACSYCYIVVRNDSKTEKPVTYRGPNAAEHFLKSLMKEQEKILKILPDPIKLNMSENDNKKFKNVKICYICEKSLIVNKKRDAVRDHCHITGKFRGAVHNECDLKLKAPPYITQIPVVCHNLKGYDSHLIMQEI